MAARLPGVLPSREDLGEMPPARTGRGVAVIDMDAVAAPGRGLAAIGRGISKLGANLQQQQDEEEGLEVQRRLLELEQDQARVLDDRRRTLSGDPQGFANTFVGEFTQAGRQAFADAQQAGLSQRALSRLAQGLTGLRERFHTQAYTHQLNQRGSYGMQWVTERLDKITQDYLKAPDDEARERILRSAEETVRLGRQQYGFSSEAEQRLMGTARQMLELDALSRSDPYAALLELREGDPRARVPSAGSVSDLGLAHILRSRLARSPLPSGQTRSPAETAAELRRLRAEGARVSRWLAENLRKEDGSTVTLTQLQLDALVGFALTRPEGKPEDALEELLPVIRTGNWESVASAIRSGSVAALEQPAPTTAGTVAPGAGRRTPRFSPEVDSAIVTAARRHGLDPDLMRRIAAIESGGDPRNVTGSYRGLFQLSSEEFGGRGDIFNPADNAEAAAANFVRHIENFRRQYDREPTAGDLYLIHQQGAGGFAAHMAQPDRLAWQSMFSTAEGQRRGEEWARQAITGNLPRSVLARLGGVDRITSQQFMAYWRGRVEGGAVGAPTPSPDGAADPALAELGDMVMGQAPASRYARLPVDRRQVLIRRLAEALRPEVKTELDSDIEHIRKTGQPRTLPDGTTWIQRARRAGVLTPRDLAIYERRIAQAEAIFRAVDGLSDMTPEQMAQRLEDLDTSRVPEGDSYVIAQRALDAARRSVERIDRLRRRASAVWASGAYLPPTQGSIRTDPTTGALHSVPAEDDLRVQPPQEVMEAYRLLARRNSALQLQFGADGSVTVPSDPNVPGQFGASPRPQTLLLTDPRLTQDDRRLIIDARLAAMARVGIPVADRRILRPDEAATLLGLPSNLSGMQPADFETALRRASRRAEELFGPRYARTAFLDALSFRRLNEDRQRTVRSIADYAMPQGRGAADALDREEALWRFGYQMTPPGFAVGELEPDPRGPMFQGVSPEFGMGQRAVQPPPTGWFGSTPQPPPGTGVRTGQEWPKPTPEHIAALQRNPALQGEFDATFGPGASLPYLPRPSADRPGLMAQGELERMQQGMTWVR